MHSYTNRLIHETSPYLLQHAHNPVDWYPWGPEALQKAVDDNKPILVSIGYSACHWCHVMERESFEDADTAKIMNEHFINIKIDREERPDLDHIYMDALQAMSGSGGWPLNVFLTPDRKPFYGGTYFPPVRAFNRSSWTEILLDVSRAFHERRSEIDEQARSLTGHLMQSNGFGSQVVSEESGYQLFSREKADEIFAGIMRGADRTRGGFGGAPKFPQSFVIRFLLRYHWVTGNEEALQQALLSIRKMAGGGIYDQVAGGFARYATDTEWLVPHFEKMLYDNALLIEIISEASQLTKNEEFNEIIVETTGFIEREMMDPEGGFYAALDADSEGKEGKFYVWDYDEVTRLLGPDAPVFCRYYDITERGNWEGVNILRVKEPAAGFAERNNLDLPALKDLLMRCRKILLTARNKRVRPGLDDKILLGWNALMNTAYCKAFAATGDGHYKETAIRNMQFLVNNFSVGDTGELYHSWKNGVARHPAFLDDYAFLIRALISLYEISADATWLQKAKGLTGFVIDHFSEAGTGFFYFTKANQEDVIFRKKEVFDGAVPSGNAMMAVNLFHLGILVDEKSWKQRGMDMLVSLGKAVINYPSSFGMWACFLLELTDTTNEIVVVGKNYRPLLAGVVSAYIPHRVIMAAEGSDLYYPLLAGKDPGTATQIYLCKEFSCRQPVSDTQALLKLIKH